MRYGRTRRNDVALRRWTEFCLPKADQDAQLHGARPAAAAAVASGCAAGVTRATAAWGVVAVTMNAAGKPNTANRPTSAPPHAPSPPRRGNMDETTGEFMEDGAGGELGATGGRFDVGDRPVAVAPATVRTYLAMVSMRGLTPLQGG